MCIIPAFMSVQERLRRIKRKSAVCTVSGGLDSAVAAALIAEASFDLHFIFFDYGQKTGKKELWCAKALARHYKTDLKIVKVPFLKDLPGVSMTRKEKLTTKYNEYVPNRNTILESQAVAYAEHLRAGVVCVGSSGGNIITPDNSLKFIRIMQMLIDEGTQLKPPIQIVAPLLSTNKAGAVQLGLQIGVPFKLTWSCHNQEESACGKCSNCKSRIEAFKLNDHHDPIRYEKIG